MSNNKEFEMKVFMVLWLIVKGFNPVDAAPETTFLSKT